MKDFKQIQLCFLSLRSKQGRITSHRIDKQVHQCNFVWELGIIQNDLLLHRIPLSYEQDISCPLEDRTYSLLCLKCTLSQWDECEELKDWKLNVNEELGKEQHFDRSKQHRLDRMWDDTSKQYQFDYSLDSKHLRMHFDRPMNVDRREIPLQILQVRTISFIQGRAQIFCFERTMRIETSNHLLLHHQ